MDSHQEEQWDLPPERMHACICQSASKSTDAERFQLNSFPILNLDSNPHQGEKYICMQTLKVTSQSFILEKA